MNRGSFFTRSISTEENMSSGQTPQYNIPIVAHIIGAHSGMPIDTKTGLLKMIQVTGKPCIEYWQAEIGTVGVCPASAMDEYTAYIINRINTLKTHQYNPDDYEDLFHKLNILCESKSRSSNMPGLTIDVDEQLVLLSSLIDKYIISVRNPEQKEEIKKIEENIINENKSINESLVAIKTFTSDESIGTLTYYPVGSYKFDVAFMPQNDSLPDSIDAKGNVFTSMNWRDWLTIIANVPSTREQNKDPIVTQIENSSLVYNTRKSTIKFFETLGAPWAVGQNTRSRASQQGYLESQMRYYLPNTFVCNIYFGCRVIVKIDERGVFEDEETRALNVKNIISRSEIDLKRLNDTLPYETRPRQITLEQSIARIRNLRSDEKQLLKNKLDEEYNKKQKVQLIKLINKLKAVSGFLWTKLRKDIIQGGTKPKKSKTKKRRNYKSKRRNNRKTYRKKSRSTRRRRY
jgi:hypothetical protein